jgi:hypothetical protein
MITPRASHWRISSVPNLLLNQDHPFPCGGQYITQAAIIEGGTRIFTKRVPSSR